MTEVKEIKKRVMDVYELEIEDSLKEYGKIHRIVLKTNMGNITYRPYQYISESRKKGNFMVRQRKKILLGMDEISPMLWELNRKMKTGICKVKLSYFFWKKEKNRDPIRFIKEKQIEEMVFINMEENVV